MGFIPPLLATAGAAAGSAAAGVGTGASLGAGLAATAAAAPTLTGLGAGIASALPSAALLGGSLALSKALQPPRLPKPPQPPDPSQFLKPGSTALIGPGEGTFGGTFLGNNRSPQISGGKKTLLGQ